MQLQGVPALQVVLVSDESKLYTYVMFSISFSKMVSPNTVGLIKYQYEHFVLVPDARVNFVSLVENYLHMSTDRREQNNKNL